MTETKTKTKDWVEVFKDWAEATNPSELDFGGQEIPERLRELLERGFYLKTLEDYQEEIFEINEANGWFESERAFGEDIALLHSEVSEMFEAFRDHGLEDVTKRDHHDELDGKLPKPEGVGSEAADVAIRLFDTCRRAGIALRWEIERKNAFNRTRGHRHGGKRV